MNPIALLFANGNVFFIGMTLAVVAAVFQIKSNGRIAKFLQSIFWFVGIGLVILSATPLPVWSYGLWLVLCAGQQFAGSVQAVLQFRTKLAVLFILCSAAMCFMELRYRLSPVIAVSQNQQVYVIGDSISAGIADKERAWPSVLEDLSHFKVTNLARPGASVESAVKQADGIHDSHALVILEIGGNDLLGNTDTGTFYDNLNSLLKKLSTGDNQVVMFELPLFPFRNSFGKTQRVLADKYHVTLIPKTYLTKVFGLKDATLDGLHLSQEGHNALANIIFGLLRPPAHR